MQGLQNTGSIRGSNLILLKQESSVCFLSFKALIRVIDEAL